MSSTSIEPGPSPFCPIQECGLESELHFSSCHS